MKICNKCLIEKDLSEFHKDNSSKDKHTTICKECKKESGKLYRLKNKERISKVNKEYNKTRKEKTREYNRKYVKDNKEHLKEKWREYRNSEHGSKVINNWKTQNKEHISKYNKVYNKLNKEEIAYKQKLKNATEFGRAASRKHNQLRELRIRETKDGSINTETLDLLYKEQDGRCYLCSCDLTQLKRKNVHLDHIIPLSKGGKHILENVAWSCASCNLSKGDKIYER